MITIHNIRNNLHQSIMFDNRILFKRQILSFGLDFNVVMRTSSPGDISPGTLFESLVKKAFPLDDSLVWVGKSVSELSELLDAGCWMQRNLSFYQSLGSLC